jgi:hypothetical protein
MALSRASSQRRATDQPGLPSDLQVGIGGIGGLEGLEDGEGAGRADGRPDALGAGLALANEMPPERPGVERIATGEWAVSPIAIPAATTTPASAIVMMRNRVTAMRRDGASMALGRAPTASVTNADQTEEADGGDDRIRTGE